jgi:hypothetical protein
MQHFMVQQFSHRIRVTDYPFLPVITAKITGHIHFLQCKPFLLPHPRCGNRIDSINISLEYRRRRGASPSPLSWHASALTTRPPLIDMFWYGNQWTRTPNKQYSSQKHVMHIYIAYVTESKQFWSWASSWIRTTTRRASLASIVSKTMSSKWTEQTVADLSRDR